VNVSHNAGTSEQPACAVDSRGTVHLVWTDNTPGIEQGDSDNEEILYAYKRKDSSWSEPANISDNEWASRFPTIAVGPDDKIHVAWQDASPDGHWRIFYSQKAPDAVWTVPETISGDYGYVGPKLAVDNRGDAHVVWQYGGYYEGIMYVVRHASGGWSAQEVVVPYPQLVHDQAIVADPARNIHLAWFARDNSLTVSNIYYSVKPEGGAWSAPLNISNTDSAVLQVWLGVDRLDNLHCLWDDNAHPYLTPDVLHRERHPDGTWSETEPASKLHHAWLEPTGTLDASGNLYVWGGDAAGALFYVVKPETAEFSDSAYVGKVQDYVAMGHVLACSPDGTVNLVWGTNDIYWFGFQPRERR
jgi:hypothetical protein